MIYTQDDINQATLFTKAYYSRLLATGQYPLTELFTRGNGGLPRLVEEGQKYFEFSRVNKSQAAIKSEPFVSGSIIDSEKYGKIEISMLYPKLMRGVGPRYGEAIQSLCNAVQLFDFDGEPSQTAMNAVMAMAKDTKAAQDGLMMFAEHFAVSIEYVCVQMLSKDIATVNVDGVNQSIPTGQNTPYDVAASYGGSWASAGTDIGRSLFLMAKHHRDTTGLPIDLMVYSADLEDEFRENTLIQTLLNNNSAVMENFGDIPAKIVPRSLRNAEIISVTSMTGVDGVYTNMWNKWTVGFYSFGPDGISQALALLTEGNELNNYQGGISTHLWKDDSTLKGYQSASDNFAAVIGKPKSNSLFTVI